MPSNTFYGMQHLNENMMCAIGVMTTGPDYTEHEIIDFAAIPLDAGIDMRRDSHLFHMACKPDDLTNHINVDDTALANVLLYARHGMDVADIFYTWYEKLRLQPGKKIIPLSWNWVHDSMFIRRWIGDKNFENMFHWHYRDVLATQNHINDLTDQIGNPITFPKVVLGSLATRFNIEQVKPKTALSIARTTYLVYKELLKYRARPLI